MKGRNGRVITKSSIPTRGQFHIFKQIPGRTKTTQMKTKTELPSPTPNKQVSTKKSKFILTKRKSRDEAQRPNQSWPTIGPAKKSKFIWTKPNSEMKPKGPINQGQPSAQAKKSKFLLTRPKSIDEAQRPNQPGPTIGPGRCSFYSFRYARA
ncbi:unnamed protein product [Dovyalis caffra]|uniref:Uncharacterized protein n=1 Tax=Dovyalis caffra TaxID=77055 RepID=A0AAV1RR66_9ROSI|nr:unnamed protein product [Dovyalis caffra]